jgi:hypothetical protein
MATGLIRGYQLALIEKVKLKNRRSLRTMAEDIRVVRRNVRRLSNQAKTRVQPVTLSLSSRSSRGMFSAKDIVLPEVLHCQKYRIARSVVLSEASRCQKRCVVRSIALPLPYDGPSLPLP